MKSLILLISLISMVASAEAFDVRAISKTEAKKLVASGKAVWVDAREAVESRKDRQPAQAGAIAIPYLTLERNPESWKTHLKNLPKSKSLIVFCTNGARSRPLAERLAGAGYPTFLLK